MQRLTLILTGTAVMGTALLLLFGGFLSPASAASPINFMNPALGGIFLCSNVRLAQNDDSGSFDRETCEQTCRYRYGVSPLPQVEEQGWERAPTILSPAIICLPSASTHVIDSIGDISTGRWRT